MHVRVSTIYVVYLRLVSEINHLLTEQHRLNHLKLVIYEVSTTIYQLLKTNHYIN